MSISRIFDGLMMNVKHSKFNLSESLNAILHYSSKKILLNSADLYLTFYFSIESFETPDWVNNFLRIRSNRVSKLFVELLIREKVVIFLRIPDQYQ